MKEYLSTYREFLIIALIWISVGMFLGPTIYLVLPVMLLLMYKKEMHLEIFLGFFLILTLSDSRSSALHFASQAKNIYIVLLFLFALGVKSKTELQIKMYQYFIPFFIVALICIAFNPVPFLSFQKILSYILLFISIPIYFQYAYNKYGDFFLKSIVFLVMSILLFGFVINVLNPSFTNLVGRYKGMLGNPNGLGLYTLLFIILFTVIIDTKKELYTRREIVIIYIISFLSLIMCGARTSLFASFLFLFFRKFYKMSPLLGFFIFIISLAIYQAVSSNIELFIAGLGLSEFLRVDTFSTMSGRDIAWEFAWQQIQPNFFIGKGFSYTEYIYKANYEYLSLLGHQGAAHNSYLTFWLDTGLVGLVLFLIGLIITFFKASKLSALAIPVLYAVLLSNNFESWITASLNPFTIQLLLILSVIFSQKNNLQESINE